MDEYTTWCISSTKRLLNITQRTRGLNHGYRVVRSAHPEFRVERGLTLPFLETPQTCPYGSLTRKRNHTLVDDVCGPSKVSFLSDLIRTSWRKVLEQIHFGKNLKEK